MVNINTHSYSFEVMSYGLDGLPSHFVFTDFSYKLYYDLFLFLDYFF